MGRGALITEGGANGLWLRGALNAAELATLDRIADGAGLAGGRVNWADPDMSEAFEPVTALVQAHALPGAFLTRVVWFTKDAQSNWGVPWHQDRVIAVADRHDVGGYRNWSHKRGIWHCEPPAEILAHMRFVRVHLDPCDFDNGAMEIASGSHAAGLVPEPAAAITAARYPAEPCVAARGDIQILPMLVLHRSRPANTQTPRRALRLDFAALDLPHPLRWHAA